MISSHVPHCAATEVGACRPQGASPPRPLERRRFARYTLGNAQAVCRRLPLAFLRPNLARRVVDLSAGGAKVIMSGRVSRGERLLVRIRFPGCDERIESRARVAWVSAASPWRRHPAHVAGLAFNGATAIIERKIERMRSRRGAIARRFRGRPHS